jgi:hypothetical protein
MTTLILGLGITSRQQSAAKSMEAEIMATNMNLYVSAVESYAAGHKMHTGSVAQNQLKLPFGWKSASRWRNTLTKSQIFIYGPPLEDADVLSQLTHYTGDFGIKRGGQLYKPEKGVLGSLPSSIPEGSLVFATKRP